MSAAAAPPRNPTAAFHAVRNNFKRWCVNVAADFFREPEPLDVNVEPWIDLHSPDLGDELIGWLRMPIQHFASFLVGKLEPYSHLLDDEAGQKFLLGKMIDGVAETDPQLAGFLIFISNNSMDVQQFCAFLRTLVALGKLLPQ